MRHEIILLIFALLIAACGFGEKDKGIDEDDEIVEKNCGEVAVISSVAITPSIVGTWGYGEIRHSTNNNSWRTRGAKITYKADGTGSVDRIQNSNGTISSASKTFTYKVYSGVDGSITIYKTFADGKISIQQKVISDDNNVMIEDGTDNANHQRFRIYVRLDPGKTYSANVDQNCEHYGLSYKKDSVGHRGESSLTDFDGSGNYSFSSTSNQDGTIVSDNGSGTYLVNADGSTETNQNANVNSGFIAGDGNVSLSTNLSDPSVFNIDMKVIKGDIVYSTAKLQGNWAFVGFGDNDIDNLSFRAEFGSFVCDVAGSCTYNMKIARSDGTIDYYPPFTDSMAVAADGSLGTVPSYGTIIGNNGNTILMNNSTGISDVNSDDRAIAVAIKCSACSNLSDGGVTQLTNNIYNDGHAYYNSEGTKITFHSDRSGNFDVWVMDADGSNPIRITTNAKDDLRPFWSPDGTQIVFQSDRADNDDIWIIDADGTGNNLKQLTTDSASDSQPVWNPGDSTVIAFTSSRSNVANLWELRLDAGQNVIGVSALAPSSNPSSHPMWNPGGTKLAFAQETAGVKNIWIMDADGTNLIQVTDNIDDEQHADWSPDGTKLAFRSNKAGNYDIWVIDTDGSNQTRVTTTRSNERNPDWHPVDNKIMFRSNKTGNNEVYVYTLP